MLPQFKKRFFDQATGGVDVGFVDGSVGEEEADAGGGFAGGETDEAAIEKGFDEFDGFFSVAAEGGEADHAADAVGAFDEARVFLGEGVEFIGEVVAEAHDFAVVAEVGVLG